MPFPWKEADELGKQRWLKQILFVCIVVNVALENLKQKRNIGESMVKQEVWVLCIASDAFWSTGSIKMSDINAYRAV